MVPSPGAVTGGEVQNISVKVGVFQLFAWRLARGSWGHAPPRNFLKMVCFGEYFAKILLKKNSKNIYFLYKNNR